MTELDRWQEDARSELEMSGAEVTWEAVNELAERMRRNHKVRTRALTERDRVSDAERRRRRVMMGRMG